MDSGLGSDEEQRRSRTKEQKQRHNEQLLNGGTGAHCFIDASSLRDDDEIAPGDEQQKDQQHHRRSEERRQGALLFQTSIPQYSTMLQLPAGGSSSTPPDTPFNSIVNVEHDLDCGSLETASKPSLGFYVDLSEVEIESAVSTSAASTTKNIFSMVIDFEAPKKDMPTRLLRNSNGRLKSVAKKETSPPIQKKSSSQLSQIPSRLLANAVEDVQENGTSGFESKDESNATSMLSLDSVNDTREPKDTSQFVSLADLMSQTTKVDTEACTEFISHHRMSKSIPESSWIESPLMMSRSAGYRIAPRPLEPDSSLQESTGSQVAPSQRRLGTDLLRMFLEEMDTDTVIRVGSRSIKAHRCILISRCQYFAGTLRGRSLTIDGFSYDAVHFALCHIYSGAAHVPDSISLVELASLADMLSLEGLKEVVAHALKSRHCHHFHSPCAGCLTGVLEVLPLSAAYGLDELYLRCLKWIRTHYLRVWPSRAFASLPKELRDKCHQQHIVHMSADTVLETHLTCDQLLVSLPNSKWAEPVAHLGMQLAQACQTYVTQHYVVVLRTLVHVEPWKYPRVEEIMMNATEGLNLDQECRGYIGCYNLLEKSKVELNATLHEILDKLCGHFEKRLQHKSSKLTKCPSWNKMDAKLKVHLKKICKIDEAKSRTEPSRLPRMIASKVMTSSSESSRNSSPATSQAHPSPSLRRSLLLAAKAPQVPPSPSTVRRISTLTMPTAASAAKSAPPRPAKPQSLTVSISKPRPTSAPTARKAAPRSAPVPAKPVAKKEPKRPVTASGARRVPPKQSPKTTSAAKADSPKKGMQRSSTFLKEEPTVLPLANTAQQ